MVFCDSLEQIKQIVRTVFIPSPPVWPSSGWLGGEEPWLVFSVVLPFFTVSVFFVPKKTINTQKEFVFGSV
jgi:hypothetical protein